ncbi:hypothetical protein HK105_202551 [Polyrhizophydium stewartii]|uniref:Aminopeptidase n=1 Tax=Polyrhizophydium stewartii TaxID=2732419 RepID=A0ABR4NDS1_9FUNG
MPFGISYCACRDHRVGRLERAEMTAMAASGDFVPASTLSKYAPNMVIEPVHLDMALDFHLEAKTLHAVVEQTFVNPHDANSNPGDPSVLRTLRLDAIGFLDLEVTGAGVTHRYDGQSITLSWSTPFGPNEKRVVRFKYTIEKPISGLYFDVPDEHYKGFPDRMLHVITDHESERARYWLPVVDFPAVRTTLSFEITAPQQFQAVANGALVGETVNAQGLKTTKYKLDTPCPSYLICLAVGDFVSIDDEPVDGMPIKYLAPKGYNPEDLKRALGRTPAMIRWIEKKLDYKFPWPKYFQIFSRAIGGAMENISLVTWLDRYIPDELLHQELVLNIDDTNMHEMAHTYFGDLIVIRHFEHIWLKESWATYVSTLWLEDNVSEDQYRYDLWLNASRYFAEAASYMRPIVTRKYDSSWRMFDSHTYPGGAYRLHMLRKHVGDDAFFRGVQKYVKAFACKTAETDDFRKCIEAESGINLVPFFDQWLYSKGYPKLKGSLDIKTDQRYVAVTLEQTQVDVAAGIPFFNIAIDVEITDTDGKTFEAQVVFDNPSQTKAFAVIPIGGAKPKVARFDPHGRMLFSLDVSPGEGILAATAAEAKDVANRIWAYQELIKAGGLSAMRKVRAAMLKEPFYGVRVQIAAALARAKTAASLELLGELLTAERDPKAYFPMVLRMSIRDDSVRKALRTFVERPNVPYRSRGKALENLGLQRNADDLAYLMSVATDPNQLGMHGHTRGGALRGLGNMRSEVAFDYLMSRTAPGIEPILVRPALYSAIAASAVWQNQQRLRLAIELFEDGLRDLNTDLRFACVRGLITLDSKSSADAILDMESTMEECNFTTVKSLVRRLRSSTGFGPGVSADKVKELFTLAETLEGRLKKIEEAERLRELRELTLKEQKEKEAKEKEDKDKAAEAKL